MKTIELKTVKVHIKVRSNQKKVVQDFKYYNWIYDSLLETGANGVSKEVSRERNKILNKLEALPKGAKKFEAEDAEFGIIKERINAMTWVVMANEIDEFITYINSLNK